MNRSELVPIHASTFRFGMHVEPEVYYKYRNSFVLLCKDVTLDAAMLLRLRQCEQMDQTLYVNKAHYHPILEISRLMAQDEGETEEPVKPQKKSSSGPAPQHLNEMEAKIRLAEEYRHVTEHTGQLLDALAQADEVAVGTSETLSHEIGQQLEMTDASILLQCVNTMRSVHTYLYSHSANVAMLNGLIGQWMHLEPEEIQTLIQTGLLHDIGKLRVPEEILNKPGKLTPEEFRMMQSHPIISEELLRGSGITDDRILQGARSHHERMNGLGYPDGLHGYAIPLFARITAVSDTYDAMVAQRPFQERKMPFAILNLFATNRFSDLDIEIINTFLANITHELVGRAVVLSDGRRGRVSYISPQNFAYPLVQVGGKTIQTNEQLHCVEMENLISMLG